MESHTPPNPPPHIGTYFSYQYSSGSELVCIGFMLIGRHLLTCMTQECMREVGAVLKLTLDISTVRLQHADDTTVHVQTRIVLTSVVKSLGTRDMPCMIQQRG